MKIIKESILLVIAASTCLLILEGMARIVLPDTPFHGERDKYGWSRKENETLTESYQDIANNAINVTSIYSKNGFKRWGNAGSSKTKVLIIGDSYTDMCFVPNGAEWYSYLENKYDDVEFFVYGRTGYSTLQEYMILDDYYDLIKPDIIVWQFSDNDYRNSLWAYDKTRFPFCPNKKRPYLENGTIVYRFPGPFNGLRKYSKLFDYFMAEYQDVFLTKLQHLKENYKIMAKRRSSIYKKGAFEVVNETFSMVRARSGIVPFYMIKSGIINDAEKNICLNNNITCIEGLAEYMNKKEEITVLEMSSPHHKHWNMEGNEAVGEYLIDYFEKRKVFVSDYDTKLK